MTNNTLMAIALGVGAVVLVGASETLAHPGGLNSAGCHNNRKTGDYHCHGGQASNAPTQRPQAAYNSPSPKHSPRDAFMYRNCAEARASGAAPVRRGSYGYGPHLDRDGDGIGCEPYKGR